MNVIKAGKGYGPDVVIAEHCDWKMPMAQKQAIFAEDADVLFAWLREVIPGGTFDQLCNRLEQYNIQKRRGLHNEGDSSPASGIIR